MTSKTLWRVGLFALCCALLGTSLADARSRPKPRKAVQMLNEWRARVGVGPVTFDAKNTAGCRRHANYYRLNDTTGHFEKKGRPGYTKSGHEAAASSVLSYGSGSDGPYAWENAVYHRTSLLKPDLATAGFYSAHGLACMGVFGTADNFRTETFQSYTYPYNGQRKVATTFDCNETPNPCMSVPGNDGNDATGFIPSVQFSGPFESQGSTLVSSVAMTTASGKSVSVVAEDRRGPNGGYLDGGLAVIPKKPLRSRTRYTVRVSGVLEDTLIEAPTPPVTTPEDPYQPESWDNPDQFYTPDDTGAQGGDSGYQEVDFPFDVTFSFKTGR